ncbi:MAG: GNAT family N-acetyltransferase [Pseudobdellovibrionaceae bacterium]
MLEFFQIRKNRVHQFRPKVEILNDKGPFILKTVTNSEELIEALRLRYEVFHREMIGKSKPRGIDVDEFDFICDHLIIQEKKTMKIVGTYRLNCSLFSQQFYSANEFNLRRILERPGTKLELGRACIHKDFRRGIVIALLWRGIGEYMNKTNSDVLFGCASIKTESARQAALLYRHFELEERFQENSLCPPTMKYAMPALNLWIQSMKRPLSLEEQSEVTALIPPLCRAYLKAGASLGGEPAYDQEFKCIDFLTILERENLNRALWRKYNLCPSTDSQVHHSTLTASSEFPAAVS